MTELPRRTGTAVFLCFALAAGAMLWHAWEKSPTFDETGHLQAGFYHWRHHDMERGIEHPPLLRLWAALPLNFMNLADPQDVSQVFLERPLSVKKEQLYGTFLVYQNPGASAQKIIFSSRVMMILVTLLLLALVYKWSRELYGERGGLLSLFLASTFPPLLGHGTLIATDVGGAATALLAAYSLSILISGPTFLKLICAGLALGLAQAAKLSNVILIPMFFYLMVVHPGIEGRSFLRRLTSFIAVLVLAFFALNCFYLFQNVMPPHGIHPTDLAAYGWGPFKQFLYRWAPLPDFYLLSMGFLSHHMDAGFTSYVLGRVHSTGVWYYFPLIFLVRTPLAALASFAGSFFSLKKFRLENKEIFLIIFPLAYFVFVLASKLNLGVRHILFVYPFLFVFAGRLAAFWDLNPRKKWVAALIAFHLLETFWLSPDFLAFYNLPSGGPRAGTYYSVDMDYGQDLKALGKFMESKPGAELVLSYFGTDLPEAYGMNPQTLLPAGSLFHSNKINSESPSQEFLAVSISQIRGLMTGEETFRWLLDKKPEKILGQTIYVYDITSDRDSHLKLAEIYEARGEKEKAARHMRRAKEITEKK